MGRGMGNLVHGHSPVLVNAEWCTWLRRQETLPLWSDTCKPSWRPAKKTVENGCHNRWSSLSGLTGGKRRLRCRDRLEALEACPTMDGQEYPLIRPSGTFSPTGEKERMASRRLHVRTHRTHMLCRCLFVFRQDGQVCISRPHHFR